MRSLYNEIHYQNPPSKATSKAIETMLSQLILWVFIGLTRERTGKNGGHDPASQQRNVDFPKERFTSMFDAGRVAATARLASGHS